MAVNPLEALRLLHKHRLYLPIEKQWRDMINSGEKTDDYRPTTGYYISRICKRDHRYISNCYNCNCRMLCFRKVETDIKIVTFHNYGKSPVDTYRVKKIRLGYGHTEWGAPVGLTFIIELGECLTERRRANE